MTMVFVAAAGTVVVAVAAAGTVAVAAAGTAVAACITNTFWRSKISRADACGLLQSLIFLNGYGFNATVVLKPDSQWYEQTIFPLPGNSIELHLFCCV